MKFNSGEQLLNQTKIENQDGLICRLKKNKK